MSAPVYPIAQQSTMTQKARNRLGGGPILRPCPGGFKPSRPAARRPSPQT